MVQVSIVMFNGREYLVSNAKCLKLDIEVPHNQMAQEAKALRDKFVPYRSTYDTQGWYSLPIIGKSSTEPYAWNQYSEYNSAKDAAFDMQFTDIAEQCPITVNWLKTVYPSNSYGRVRFMLLEPGGYILPHQDRESTEKRLSVCNISLNNPEGCQFVFKDKGKVPFKDVRSVRSQASALGG